MITYKVVIRKEDKDVGQYIDMTEYWGIEGAKMLKDELTKINNRNTKLIAPTLVLKFKKSQRIKENSNSI